MRNPLRLARLLILTGRPLPIDLTTTLVAMGVDVAALEQRLVQNDAFRS